jgi:type II secretory pathway predicted ATPase ExeA
MYESYYGLKERPFSLLPDPGFLYLSTKHRMALSLLEYGLMNQAGFSVVTGGIGTGKTTLIRHLLGNMGRDITVGLISNTHSSFGELLQWILMAYNLEHSGKDKVSMYQTFVDFMIGEYGRKKRTVLIVDEAQNLSPETLEELRMLSNINADKHQVLQVILAGQPGLRDLLRRPDLEQFAQRIAVDYNLEPLTTEETAGYIRHRIEVAGGDPALFEPEACAIFHRYSGGTPRLINLLCDTALVYGYAEQLPRIDASLALDVARDKAKGGIFPSRHHAADTGSEPAGATLDAPESEDGLKVKKSTTRDGRPSTPHQHRQPDQAPVPVLGGRVPDNLTAPETTRDSSEPRDTGASCPIPDAAPPAMQPDMATAAQEVSTPEAGPSLTETAENFSASAHCLAPASDDNEAIAPECTPAASDTGISPSPADAPTARRGGRLSKWWSSASTVLGVMASHGKLKSPLDLRRPPEQTAEPAQSGGIAAAPLPENGQMTVNDDIDANCGTDADATDTAFGHQTVATPAGRDPAIRPSVPGNPIDESPAAETSHTQPSVPPPPAHRASVWRKKLRIVIASDSTSQRERLRTVLEKFGMEVIAAVGLYEDDLRRIPRQGVDVVLVDLDENVEQELYFLEEILGKLDMPILFSDSTAPHNTSNPRDFEKKLTLKLFSLMRSAS